MTRFRSYLLWFVLIMLHTWLFFEQTIGLNALIFSLFLLALATWCHDLQKEKTWWMMVTGHLIISIAVFWHGNFAATTSYYYSSFILAGVIFTTRSSLPLALLNGMAGSFAVSFLAMLPEFVNDIKHKISSWEPIRKFRLKKAYLYVAPITVTLIFYFLYSLANPDFFLELRFPEFDVDMYLVVYVIFGSVIMCPFAFPWGFKTISKLDLEQPEVLQRIRKKTKSDSLLGLVKENQQGVIMFAMLNILIIVFLIFNVLQIFIPALNQSNSSHSEEVHQGFTTLIMSIIVAIVLIMYYFRENQNFYARKGRLVSLVTAWIVLNGLLAMFTCYKNLLYVYAYGLTYKRIWVFVAIILTVTGLILTLLKIKNLKTNWHLIRQNSWVIYFVVCSYVLVDWDRLITWYNLNFAQELDMDYIVDLGDSKLPYLKELSDDNDLRVKNYQKTIEEMVSRAYFPGNSWKSSTMDNIWLKRELKK